MKIEDVKVGMKVRILPTACYTKYSTFSDTRHKGAPGWDEEMQALVGTIQEVSFVDDDSFVEAAGWYWLAEDLEPVVETQKESVYPNPPHKHKDLIIAWANGADIQVSTGDYYPRWQDVKTPLFSADHEYRIKPQQKNEPPKAEWIKVDGVRPEGIPDGTKVEWVSKDGRSGTCILKSLDFQKGQINEVIFIKIVD